jgi:hypothetical protein
MHIDKQEIVKLLHERGDHDEADRAEKELPEQVHHEEHRDLLEQFGVSQDELTTKLRTIF